MAKTEAGNGCEHCDHDTPVGKRFCSKACEKCEYMDVPDDGQECAGFCQFVKIYNETYKNLRDLRNWMLQRNLLAGFEELDD